MQVFLSADALGEDHRLALPALALNLIEHFGQVPDELLSLAIDPDRLGEVAHRLHHRDFVGELDRVDRVRIVLLFRSEEHTSELQSLMLISYAVFCLKKKNKA